MVWPLVIGAAIGALAGGFSGDDGFDMKRALMGGALGAFTGGVGGAALGGGAAIAPTAAMSAGPLAANTAGLSSLGAVTATRACLSVAPSYATGICSSGLGIHGMGGGALTGPSAAYTAPSVISGGGYPAMTFAQRKAASTPFLSGGSGGAGAGEEAITGKDFSKLGDAVQQSIKEEPEESIDARLLDEQAPLGRGDSSIQAELDASARNIARQERVTPSGLSGVTEAARGGIMRVPSGSLTGGLLVGPGTGTSDSISSAIFPDIASKLGASSMQAIQGGGHAVQRAALSDGEYVLTAKAVKGFGKQAGAPPGQEREYGSKLLDNVMNQMQRV